MVHGGEALLPFGEASPVVEIPIRAAVDGLAAAGRIDCARQNEAVNRLGLSQASLPPATHPPQPGNILLFDINTIEELALAGLLTEAASIFDVRVDQDYLDYSAGECAAVANQLALADRLRALRTRTLERLTSGHWRLLLFRDLSDQWANKRRDNPISPVELSLLELLALPADQPSALWVDDRMLSRYHHAEGHPIIGITDVLAALREVGTIDAPRYFVILDKLRQARVHFIPITAEEVLHHLRAAPMNTQGMVETPALAALRRSVADTLLLEEYWALPPPSLPAEDVRTFGEFRQPLGLKHLFEKVLLAIWQLPEIDAGMRHAWATWANDALRIRRFERIPVINNDYPGLIERISIASCFVSMLPLLGGVKPENFELCRDLANWIDANLVGPAAVKHSEINRDIAGHIASWCTSSLLSEETAKILCRRLLGLLPEGVREFIHEHSTLIESLGLQITGTIEISDFQVNCDQFWDSIHAARQGQTGVVTTTDGKTTIEVTLTREGDKCFYDFCGGLSLRWVANPAFALLDDDAAVRRAVLAVHPEWIDRSPAEQSRAVAEIVAAPSRADRMQLVAKRQLSSVCCRLQEWREALSNNPGIDFRPSPAQDLIGHLRLDVRDGAGAANTLAKAASSLVAELSVDEAVKRLAGLPIPLPAAITDAFETMHPTVRSARLELLDAEMEAPMARLQVLALMRRFDHHRFSTCFDRLLDDWPKTAEAFLAILRWTERAGDNATGWTILPGAIRLILVWSHAHQVAEVLLGAGRGQEQILKHFQAGKVRQRFDQVLMLRPDYEGDASFPDTSLNTSCLLYHGLAAVVENQGQAVLTEAQRQRLEATLYIPNGDQQLPHPGLLRHRRDAVNGLGSFLTLRPLGIFESQPDIGWQWTKSSPPS